MVRLPFQRTVEAPRKVLRLEFDNGYTLNVMSNQLPFTIGRSADCNLVVASHHVSRSHCTIEMVDDEVHIVDQSTNGTFIDDFLLKNESSPIKSQIHVLFGGEFMLALSPYDAEGNLVKHTREADDHTESIVHGICLVDICDSTEKTPDQVGNITQFLRIEILKRNRDKLLLIKNTGDGFLLIYEDTACALDTAARVLQFQNDRGREYGCDLRVTLDAGMTSLTADQDRLGLAINRAARIEKTQAGNIEERGPDFEALKARNRCILTNDMRHSLLEDDQETCDFIGSCKLKGFGETMHAIYQYPVPGIEPQTLS